jgi:hypothetical protein
MNRKSQRPLAIFLGIPVAFSGVGVLLATLGVARWEVVLIVLLAMLLLAGEYIRPQMIND